MQCRMLPLDIAMELDRLTPCTKVKVHDRMPMASLDPDCFFIAEIGQLKVRHITERPFSERLFASLEGSSDEEEQVREYDSSEEAGDIEVEIEIEIEPSR
jgi:hypothetical protein